MQTLPQPTTNGQATYVTLSQTRAGHRLYAPVVVSARGRRNAPVHIRLHTVRNTLSVAMTYAHAKGLPFRLEHPELTDDLASVWAELVERYGIEVEVEAEKAEALERVKARALAAVRGEAA